MDMSLSQIAKLAAAPPRVGLWMHKWILSESMTPIGVIMDGGIDAKTTTSHSFKLVQSFCGLGRLESTSAMKS